MMNKRCNVKNKKSCLMLLTVLLIVMMGMLAGSTTVYAAAISAGDGEDVSTGTDDLQNGGGETSSKNQLKSLTVAEGNLSPEFSPEVTEYKLLVPASVTSIVVTAQPADAKAKVSKVNGFNNLEFGENEGSVTVTGADGSTLDYKIVVTRSESDEPLEEQSINDDLIPITDSTLMVSTTFPAEMLPAGFEKTEITYEEVAVEAAKFNMGEMLLLYMTDEAGANGAFYIYDTVSGGFMDFIQIQGIEGRFIIVMQPDESVTVPGGFTKATLQWGTKTVSAWMPAAGVSDEARIETDINKYPAEHILSNIYAGMAKAMVVHAAETTEPEAEGGTATAGVEYFLVYAMSSEGRKGWYLYDSVEGTYQRYLQMAFDNSDGAAGNGERADEGVVDYKKQSNQRFVIICVLAVLLVILLILVFNLFLKLRDAKSDKAEEEIPSLKKKASIQPIRKEPVRLRKARDEMDYLLDRADSGEDEEESYGDSDEDEDDEDIVFEVSPSKKKKAADLHLMILK